MVIDKINRQLSKDMEYFFRYYPARIRNVGEDAIDARELVWAFKDGEANAFEEVAQLTAECLNDKYGNRVKTMVLVCVPSSSKEGYFRRFSDFCQRVSELSGIGNGFSHVCILEDRKTVHEHRRGKKKESVKLQHVELDGAYFKDKEVCVFDDIITTGNSYAEFANMLECNGANVIGGMFLGKTFYRYRYYDEEN